MPADRLDLWQRFLLRLSKAAPSATRKRWTCIYCGTHVYTPSLDLACVACECGVGSGRWGVTRELALGGSDAG